MEMSAINGRLESVTHEVESMTRKENQYQSEFASLLEEKDRLLSLVQQADMQEGAILPNGVESEQAEAATAEAQ